MSGEVLAAWAGAGVALVAAGLATWQAMRASSAAHRSADADERAAAAAERALTLAEDQANRYVPEWQLSHDQGDRYLLANGSDETAYDVQVVAALEGTRLLVDELEVRRIGPREAVSFAAIRTMGTRDDRVAVTWRRQNGEVHRWVHPLPGKSPNPPPRRLNR